MVEDITTLNQRRKELEARINKLELQRDKTAFLLQQLELKGKKKGSSLMINRDRNQLVSLEQFETEEISKAKRELDQLNQINQAHNQEEKNHQKIKVTIVFCLLLMTLSLFTLITIQLDHNFGVISGAPTLSGIGQNKTVQDQTGNNSPISRMLDKLSEKISLSITGAAITVNTLSESTGSEIQSSGSIQSSGLISISATPTHSTPILNSTNPATNDTNQNLTAYNQSTADGDGDPVKNIYNWKVDGISFASINLPFEGGSTDIFTREYANGNDPVVTDALWNSTGGYDGKGAYQFDGAGDIITIPSVYLNGSQNFSVFTWATTNKFDQYRTLFIKPGSLHILFANIAGGGISCRVTNTTGTINVVTTNTGVWTDSNWHFIGCQVYSNQSIEISVDGIVVRTGTYAGPHNVTTSDIIISQTGGVDWNGTVDEVMFFNHSLSPQQVLALYHNRTDLIVSQETSRGDNWSVEITPNDGSNDGTTLSSNGVTILNAKPTHLTPILNSTDPTTNNTYQNLTAYNQSTNDLDGDSVKNIYNWLKDGSSIAVLNIPFEASANLFNATDYADFDNNATSLYGSPVYNQTSGYDGKGAYEFSTADEAVILATTNFPTIGEGNYTVMAWVKTKGTPTHNYQTIFSINNYDPGFYIGGGTSLLVYDSGGLYSNAGLSLNDNLWHHVAFVRAGVVGGGNQLKFYMDGESVGSNNHVASISPATNLRIGYDGASTEDFEGTIDEFMFLNISLSPEQIKLIYQNQSNILVSNQNNVGDSWSVQITPNDGIEEGITLTSNSLVVQEYVDITNPSITIQSPLNNSRYSSNVSLTFTVSDNVAVDSCWYYLDGGANTALTGCANTSVSLTRGPHNITFYVNDTSNNLNSSGLINFSVNYLPTVDSLILNTTNPATNNTNQNLTVYNTTSDADGDSVKVIYNWLVNGTSLTLLNLPFEADDNTNTADYSGYGKNGTVVGTLTWNGNSGYDGKGAYYFDGISGNPKYVQIDDASLFDVKNFTYSVWINVNTSSGYTTILDIDNDKQFLGTHDGNYFIYGRCSGTHGTVKTDGTWHHLVWTVFGNDYILYEDGISIGTGSGCSDGTDADYLMVGSGFGGNEFFNGTIDEVLIFNRSLSSDQILALYNNKTDLIVSNETEVGENWTVQGTPNDGMENGATLTSNGVLIQAVALDTIYPTFSNTVNTSTNFRRYQNFTANITIDDETALDYYLFSTNASGTWANISTVDISGTQYNVSEQANISLAQGSQVCWLYYANDTSGNMNNSDTYCFTVVNTIPIHSNPVLNTTNPATNDTNQNLTAYNQSTADIDGDAVKNIYNWLMNGSPIAVLNMPFEGINGTTSNNAWDYSGYENNGSENGVIVWNLTGGYDGKGAYEFDSSSVQYINIPDDNALDFDNVPFTVTAWAKGNNPTKNSYGTIINKGLSGGCLFNYAFVLGSTTGKMAFGVSNGTDCNGQQYTSLAGATWGANEWHFVTGIYDGTNITYYEDGVFVTSSVYTKHNVASNIYSLRIGDGGNVQGWNGTIDNVIIFNRTLSAEQILALYNNRTDLIVSQETSKGEVWNVSITPNDGSDDGQMSESNGVLIQNTLPTAPTLILPADNSTTTNRTLSLTWNNSDDIDSDTLTYNIIIDDNPTFNNPEVNVSNISQTNSVNTTYNLETELDVDTTYYWKVSAKDGSGYGPYSTARNFTVQSYLSFTLLTSTIEFGTLSIGNSTDTTDNSPSPIWGENNGNIVFNIIVNATQYFTQAALNTSNYQFKFRENETGSFNLTLSALNFTNMLATSSTVSLVDLDWREINDDFLMDLNLTVPLDESPGVKSSTITFTIEG